MEDRRPACPVDLRERTRKQRRNFEVTQNRRHLIHWRVAIDRREDEPQLQRREKCSNEIRRVRKLNGDDVAFVQLRRGEFGREHIGTSEDLRTCRDGPALSIDERRGTGLVRRKRLESLVHGLD